MQALTKTETLNEWTGSEKSPSVSSFSFPVKIYSSTLLLMSLFILAPEASRLFGFLFQREMTSLKAHAFTFQTKWKRITAFSIKAAFILFVLIYYTVQGISDVAEYGDDAPKPKLYGYYNITTFVRNNDALALLLTDTLRWNKLIYGNTGRIAVKMINDTLILYTYKDDTVKHQLRFTPRNDTVVKHSFHYNTLPDGGVELITDSSVNLYVKLSKINPKTFLLTERGFHWINEYPFNR